VPQPQNPEKDVENSTPSDEHYMTHLLQTMAVVFFSVIERGWWLAGLAPPLHILLAVTAPAKCGSKKLMMTDKKIIMVMGE